MKNTLIIAVPLVGDPAGRQRKQAKRQEARRCKLQQVGIAQPPLAMQGKRGHRRKDQSEQVVEKMPNVEQQKMQALAHERLLAPEFWRNLPGLPQQGKPAPCMAGCGQSHLCTAA
jgi:hypothetical protein